MEEDEKVSLRDLFSTERLTTPEPVVLDEGTDNKGARELMEQLLARASAEEAIKRKNGQA